MQASLAPFSQMRLMTAIGEMVALGLFVVVLLLPTFARASVGQVTLSIGFSELLSTAGTKRVVAKGDSIGEGDTIITSSNGHVHVRFVDGALVSVRPTSVFVIQEFKYAPQQTGNTLIRFTLSTGEVRSISGAAAKEARDRFRLNTPIVAIGVRGTDFLARASSEITVATVQQGAIVMTPFDTNCRPDGLLGCDGQRARILSADMTGLALVYRSGAFDPGYQTMSSSREKSEPSLITAQDSSRQNAERAAASQRAVTPEKLIAPSSISPSNLVWGRWSSAPAPGDAMTTSFRDAMTGNNAIVGDGYFFLFRTPETTNLLPDLKTKAEFNLLSSAAFHRLSSGELAPASVDSGRFSVDFAQRSFETQLKLGAAGIPTQAVEFRGAIDAKTGIFIGSGSHAESNLAGALSLDARQAGYSFRVPVGPGSLQGATLWGR